MDREWQEKAPIKEALESFEHMRIVPFDVPGHKRGKGNPELTQFLGQKCMSIDVNSMKPLDNAGHPTSVILEAEMIAADAFGAHHAFFMVGGTTAAVQAMILAACKPGEKIILPRNVHKSAINALVLCGALPVYINPELNNDLGIALGITVQEVEEAIAANPDAKALFINNPTYYGICSDLEKITKLAHKHNMLVLVDEAHGTHFYFGKNLPPSGMSVGADMSAVSMHKSGGSLTQSSFLLMNSSLSIEYVRQIINLTQTTSASYLLMSSLDISRKTLALNGKDIFERVSVMAQYARNEINKIGGYYAYSTELINGSSIFDFDITKLVVCTVGIGLSGNEVYDILRDEYDIQVEFGDTGNILAYISVGDRQRDLERLVGALSEVKRRFQRDPETLPEISLGRTEVVVSPHTAFYSPKEFVPIQQSVGCISGEIIMCYPPGIPTISPGERITTEVLDYIQYCKEIGCLLMGMEDPDLNYIHVISEGGKENGSMVF